LTGNFGVGFRNGTDLVGTGLTRSRLASYTINSANTWEYKTITLPGPTSGTWGSTNGLGIAILWDIGDADFRSSAVSTSWVDVTYQPVGLYGGTKVASTTGATWRICGVQLEAGTVATPFERRSYGQELALCQRYFQKSVPTWGTPRSGDNYIHSMGFFKVTMRATPSLTQAYNTYGQTISIQTSNADYYVTGASSSSGTSLNAGYDASIEL
jgi:hypothetical protein